MTMICLMIFMVSPLFTIVSMFRMGMAIQASFLWSIVHTIRIEETHSPIMVTIDMNRTIGIVGVLGPISGASIGILL